MIRYETLGKVRRAKASDAAALALAFAESWRFAYSGIIPLPHLEQLIRVRTERWWKRAVRTEPNVFVIEIDGKIVGYATFGPSRGNRVYRGEIYELYILPDYHGMGLGEMLFEACRSRLDDNGMNGLIVWALEDNGLAASFYWSRGGRPIMRSGVAFGGAKIGKIAYAWH